MAGGGVETWSSIKKGISKAEQPELIEMLKGLYDLSHDNKLFLTARLAGLSAKSIEPYRKRIVDQFFPDRGLGDAKLGLARKAITDYKRATSDVAGTAELMVTYVENGARFTEEYGDINGPFYDSMISMMRDLVRLLGAPGSVALAEQFRGRLEIAEEMSQSCG